MSCDDQSTYYDAGGIETIAIIRAKLTPEQFAGFCLGNMIKYACRLNHKGQAGRDAEKAARYAGWLAELALEEQKEDRAWSPTKTPYTSERLGKREGK